MNEKDKTKAPLLLILSILGLAIAAVTLLYSKRRAIFERLHGTHEPGEDYPETAGDTIHWAGAYDWVSNILMLGQAQAIRERIVSLAQIEPGDQVVDVGCGTGNVVLLAKRQVGPEGQVFGIDASPEMIAVARRKAGEQNLDVSFDVALIEDLPFEDGRFDLAMNSFVLHHLPDSLKDEAFAEIYRVLKPGGRFLAVDFVPPVKGISRFLYSLVLGDEMMRSDIRDLSGMLAEAGFEEVQVGGTGYSLASFLSGRKP